LQFRSGQFRFGKTDFETRNRENVPNKLGLRRAGFELFVSSGFDRRPHPRPLSLLPPVAGGSGRLYVPLGLDQDARFDIARDDITHLQFADHPAVRVDAREAGKEMLANTGARVSHGRTLWA
jgi:hypothetical protein